MSIVKVIEIIASSKKGWDDAARQAVKDASRTVKNIRHLYAENLTAVVDGDEIVEFRLNGKLSFVVED